MKIYLIFLLFRSTEEKREKTEAKQPFRIITVNPVLLQIPENNFLNKYLMAYHKATIKIQKKKKRKENK